MADPRAFDNPVAIEMDEALSTMRGLLDTVPGAHVPFSERYNNPYLLGSVATLAEAARDDHQVRAEHGTNVLISGLVRVVAAQQRRIAELEATAKPAKATKGSTKR
jgi:hypothetical protein